MHDLQLTAEQIEFRDTVREFVEREVKAAATHPDRLQGYRPDALAAHLQPASAMGLRAMMLAEAAGGAGAGHLTSCIVMEELAAGDADLAAVLAQTAVLAPLIFERTLTAAQRERFLPPFLADDGFHLAFSARAPEVDTEWNYHRPAVAEPCGKISAVRQNNGDWVLNGVTEPVANAPLAKRTAVQVQTGAGIEGVRTFLVARDAPGVTVRESGGVPAWYHGTRGVLAFTNCRIPRDDVCEAGAEALAERPGLASGSTLQSHAINLGVARAAYEAALDYSKIRFQGGRHIIGHEGVGILLAEMVVRLEAARSMIWHAAWAADHPDASVDRRAHPAPLDVAAAAFVPELAHEVAVKASEVFGAMGILRDMPLHKYVHDTLVFLHAGNGVSAAKLRLAEILADYQRP
jgi:alkylation response protein AidB-like acyl-CoA dehydrogenase